MARFSSVLREREFRLLISARVVSQLGNQITPVALAFAVLAISDSATDLSLVLAAETASLALFLLVGGTFADRLSRRAVMVVADAARFVIQGAMAVLLITGTARVWHLVTLQLVSGVASAFFIPAVTAIQPETVGRDHLKTANALRSLAISVTGIIGPAAAGVLVVLLEPAYALAVDSLSFAASALLVSRMRVGASPPPSGQNVLRGMAQGWREFRSRRWLWPITLQGAVVRMFALAPFMVLGPTIMDDTGQGAGGWATVLATMGAGALAGAFFAPRLHTRRPLAVVVIGTIGFAPMLVAMALELPTPAVAAAAALGGIEQALYWTLWQTTLHQRVPSETLSRISAFDWLGAYAFQPLGYAIAGPLAALWSARGVLWAGAALLVTGALLVVAVPEVREPEHARADVQPVT